MFLPRLNRKGLAQTGGWWSLRGEDCSHVLWSCERGPSPPYWVAPGRHLSPGFIICNLRAGHSSFLVEVLGESARTLHHVWLRHAWWMFVVMTWRQYKSFKKVQGNQSKFQAGIFFCDWEAIIFTLKKKNIFFFVVIVVCFFMKRKKGRKEERKNEPNSPKT